MSCPPKSPASKPINPPIMVPITGNIAVPIPAPTAVLPQTLPASNTILQLAPVDLTVLLELSATRLSVVDKSFRTNVSSLQFKEFAQSLKFIKTFITEKCQLSRYQKCHIISN